MRKNRSSISSFRMKTWICLYTNLNVFDILTAEVSKERIDTVLTKTSGTSIVNYSHMQLSRQSFKVLSKPDLYLYFGSKDITSHKYNTDP